MVCCSERSSAPSATGWPWPSWILRAVGTASSSGASWCASTRHPNSPSPSASSTSAGRTCA
eukprot:293531-Alexandrium_andersonii.AAC.1